MIFSRRQNIKHLLRSESNTKSEQAGTQKLKISMTIILDSPVKVTVHSSSWKKTMQLKNTPFISTNKQAHVEIFVTIKQKFIDV